MQVIESCWHFWRYLAVFAFGPTPGAFGRFGVEWAYRAFEKYVEHAWCERCRLKT